MWQPKRHRAVHDRIMDLMLHRPDLTYDDIGKFLGYHKQTVMLIANSEAFRARLAERSSQISETFQNDMVAQQRAVAQQGLERMSKLLEIESDLEKVKDATEMVLDSLGMGPNRKLPGVVVNTQVNQQINATLPAGVFERARAKFGRGLGNANEDDPTHPALSDGVSHGGPVVSVIDSTGATPESKEISQALDLPNGVANALSPPASRFE